MRGITPVVSIILLLIISVVIVGAASMFLSRAVTSAGAGAESAASRQSQQLASQFRVEGVSSNKVYVRNMGANTISSGSLGFYVDGAPVTATGSDVAPNSVAEFTLNAAELAMTTGEKLAVKGTGFGDQLTANFYADNTAGYWKFDEGTGTAIKDSAGSNDGVFKGEEGKFNDGTLGDGTCTPGSGKCPAVTAGKFGSALSFDGSDDYVDVGSSASLSPVNAVTVETWIKRKSISGAEEHIVAKGNPGATGYHLVLHPSNLAEIVIGATGLVGTTVLNDTSKWYYLVGTWDGSTEKIYVNGVLEGSVAVSSIGTYTQNLKILEQIGGVQQI